MSLRAKSARAGSLSAQPLADHAAPHTRGAASWRAVRAATGCKAWFGRCSAGSGGRARHRTVSLLSSPAGYRWARGIWRVRPATQSPAGGSARVSGTVRPRGSREGNGRPNPIAARRGRRAHVARAGRLTHRFEGDARAQAGLGENHGHGHAAQRLVGHVARAIPRLELHGARQHRVQLRLCQVVDVQEVRRRRAGRAAAAPRRNGGRRGLRGCERRDRATTGAAPRRAEARQGGSRWLPHWCVHRAATDRPNATHGAGRGGRVWWAAQSRRSARRARAACWCL